MRAASVNTEDLGDCPTASGWNGSLRRWRGEHSQRPPVKAPPEVAKRLRELRDRIAAKYEQKPAA